MRTLNDSPIGRPRTAMEPMDLVTVKLPRSVADTVRRLADAEDRAVSAYLRRKIVDLVEREAEPVR